MDYSLRYFVFLTMEVLLLVGIVFPILIWVLLRKRHIILSSRIVNNGDLCKIKNQGVAMYIV